MITTSRTLVLGLLAGAGISQQYEWRTTTVFGLGTGTALASDEQRARTVMVRGSETWEWDGAVWRLRVASNPMGSRALPGFAYDRNRNVTVLFAGQTLGGNLADTWEWDGASWTAVNTANRPSWRWYGPMVYDAARQHILLSGGSAAGGAVNDTWIYDGTDWTQLSPVNSPTSHQRHTLAYDEARAVVVLFGGLDINGAFLAETWEWDGIDWTRRLPAASPLARHNHAMAYDAVRDRTFVFGGGGSAGTLADTWQWDGSNWTPIATGQPAPSTGVFYAMAFDRGREQMVLPESTSGGADTWTFDGTQWRITTLAETPGGRDGHVFAHDLERGESLMFGGQPPFQVTAETWLHRAGAWRQAFPITSPTLRSEPAVAWDPVGREILMFGGFGPSALDETWLWTGSDWQPRTPASSPPPRASAAMAGDLLRNRVVLFGGDTGGGLLGDTWEWDGSTWSQRNPATLPPPREGHAMSFDPVRGVTVMFGGGDFLLPPVLGDHWEWNGTNWTPFTGTRPAARGGHGLVFDADSQTTVMTGGFFHFTIAVPIGHNDVWEFDGVQWAQRTVSGPQPAPRRFMRAAHDPATRRTLVYGGDANSDTWLMGPVSSAAVTPYGTGCPGSFGVPELRPRGQPLVGNQGFRIQVSSLAPGAFAALGFGVMATNVTLPGGCLALVDRPIAVGTRADTRGSATFPLPLPNHPVLQGLDLFVQTATIDSAGPVAGLFALSSGIQITIDR